MNTLSQAEMERLAVELNAILERYSH